MLGKYRDRSQKKAWSWCKIKKEKTSLFSKDLPSGKYFVSLRGKHIPSKGSRTEEKSKDDSQYWQSLEEIPVSWNYCVNFIDEINVVK